VGICGCVGVWVCGCVGVWVCGWVGVYTKSKTSELSPLRRKLLRFAKQFPPPLRSKKNVPNFVLLHRRAVFNMLYVFPTLKSSNLEGIHQKLSSELFFCRL
jgi:hypothetical protein